MSFSMYQASVPGFVQTITALSKILDKAEADATARKIDPTVLLNYRLAPDMFPLVRQVQTVSDVAKGAVARLAGVDIPKFEDTEKTIPELKARLAKTLDFIQGIKASALEGSESRDVTIPVDGKPTTVKGQDYLVGNVLPNFYFHATASHAILRHCGVAIGKRDFLGRT